MKIILVATSNSKLPSDGIRIQTLQERLCQFDWIETVDVSDTLFCPKGTTRTIPAEQRAAELMAILIEGDHEIILDISGGDACNEVLLYLDWQQLQQCQQFFFGYSDVSVLLNALAEQTQMKVYNFNPLTLVGENSTEQMIDFEQVIHAPENVVHSLQTVVSQGEVVRGGNLRCSLKLAGTKWWPEFSQRTLLIESLSGNWNRIRSLLAQYEQIGTFEAINKLLIGQFQELEERKERDRLLSYLEEKAQQYEFVLQETPLIGHSPQTKPIRYRNR